MSGYLTGDTPVGFTYGRLRIPNDAQFSANVRGALLELAAAYNWTEYGTLTVDESAQLASDMFDDFVETGVWMAIGSLFPFATATAPVHCLECDGATYARADYPQLYAVLDAAFIVDADNFKVPDLRGNVVLGSDFGTGSTYPVGATGGTDAVTLTSGEMPSHSHSDIGHAHGYSSAIGIEIPAGLEAVAPVAIAFPDLTVTGFASLTNTGGGGAHENLQPYLALRWAIVSE